MSDQYKSTLNLPNTAFPMKANLASREPEMLSHWDTIQLYSNIQEKKKLKPKFILSDGPPFANGDIHMGHAVNKILKDIVLKSKWLSGYCAPFIPGWDCHGLPIELNVEKQVGKPGVKVDAKTFRKKCREYASKQIDAQRKGFIRLGVLGDWQNPYLTMNFDYEANIIRSLSKIAANGHLHKGFKPVHWCIDCGSALAEAEVEYQDKTSPAIDVGFLFIGDDIKSTEGPFKLSLSKDKTVSAVIWTTTPWTLPANQAVAVHADLTYALVQTKTKEANKEVNNGAYKEAYFVVAKDLVESLMQRMGVDSDSFTIVSECLGSQLEKYRVKHPFYEKDVPLVLGHHVTTDAGTGLVHIAPAHGVDDYQIGLKYGLPLDNPVASNGCYTSATPLFPSLHVFKANDKVIEVLAANGNLLHSEALRHSYPHCWRHKSPLIFRATQQWFISMDGNGLRKRTLESIKRVKWVPDWGQARIEGMVVNNPDWCISRQRTWSVPMSLFVHKETGELHPNTPELMEKVAVLVEKEGIDAWHDIEVESFLGKEAEFYEKSQDTLDVWFDSGVYHDCILKMHPDMEFPAHLYIEGSDQHRGWFQSSLLTSVAMKEEAPYREVLTHGFTVDAQGRKMSKSLGNVDPPEKIANSLGADVLRLWVSATDYRSEMTVSEEILKRVSDSYRRIRNTARFLLANLNGFDATQHRVPFKDMLALDQWVVNRARSLQQDIIQAYNDYQFHTVYQKIHHFCSIDLGSFYLDIIKDRQYTGKRDGLPRYSAQTALYDIAEYLVRWMAPILSFTAEEIWQNLSGKREASVFLSEWYEGISELTTLSELDQPYWATVLSIRECVNKALEEARAKGLIGSGLEAEVLLYCEDSFYECLSKLKDELRFVLITSKASIFPLEKRPSDAEETALNGLSIKINALTCPKCERCWHRRDDVGENPNYPGICKRCVDNAFGKGEERRYA